MAFTAQELYRIRRELGYHALTIGSLPYIGFAAVFDSVINQNIDAEVTTTATMAVTATSSPTPVSVTLASAAGFTAGQRAVVDVDERTETATIQSLSGSIIVVQLKLAHSGTVPISVEGPITMAKDLLRKIERVRAEMNETFGEGAIRKVDEVEFYGQRERGRFGLLGSQLMHWRDELAAVLGVQNGWAARGGGGSCAVSVY